MTKDAERLIVAQRSARHRPVVLGAEGVRTLRQLNRKLKPLEVDELARKYQAGASMASLAEMFGVHFQTVRAHLRRRGIDLRTDHPALASDQVDEAALLYAQVWSTYRLAARYGVDRSTVGKALKRVGVELRSQLGCR